MTIEQYERIRKAIIEHFACSHSSMYPYKGFTKKQILDWLEKQEGCEYIKKDWLEHIKQSWYKEGFIDGKYSGGTSKEWTINDTDTLKELIDFFENGTTKLQHDLTRYANWLKIQFTPKFAPIEKQGEQPKKHDVCDYCDQQGSCVSPCPMKLVEKQGEQKPADKVEPKFKVGDWVVNTITKEVEQVIEITSYEYICSGHLIVSFNNQHLLKGWAIEDAKPGDVLFYRGNVKYSDGIKFDRILLFENLDKSCFVLTKSSNGVEDYGINMNIDYPDNIIPATKEQRDMLFSKMREAGYEWDAEKKELKKIEQESSWSEEDEKFFKTALWHISYSISNGKRTDIHCDTTDWLKSIKDRVQSHPKQEWSEDDESKLNDITHNIHFAETHRNVTGSSAMEREQITWLKSLRSRVQPQQKQEWSEEDEDMCYKATAVINRLCVEGKEYVWSINTLKKLFYWLKSLRLQNTWKPSDEQIEALEYGIDDIRFYGLSKNRVPILEKLLEQLKELKEM